MNLETNILREEVFKELCDYVSNLHEIAELTYKLHHQGLERNEFKQLLSLIKDIIEASTKRSDLTLIKRLENLQSVIGILPDTFFPLKPRDLLLKLENILRSLPPLRPGILLPTPQELADRLNEVDTLIEVLIDNLHRYTRTLTELFNIIKPEAMPYILKFLEKNPGYVRTTIGEPLCIWWLSNILSRRQKIWRNTEGPLRIMKEEIDALSLQRLNNQCIYAIAEIKITKNLGKLKSAIDQVIRKTKLLKDPTSLKLLGHHNIKECRPREIAIVTLYRLEGTKEELKLELAEAIRREGISADAYVYDIDDILGSLKGFSGRERYHELFETINKILEST